MSDERPDGDDDPKLRSMRAVWLQMRDEDPPSSGLAELLAAARTKAVDMAVPTWWQRLAMQLRRPSVFALASVMLVLGGALLISRRVEPTSAPPPRIESASVDETTEGRARSIDHVSPPPPGKLVAPPVLHVAPPPPPPPPPPVEAQVKTEAAQVPPGDPGRFGFDGETKDAVDDVGGKVPTASPEAQNGPIPSLDQLRKQCDAAARRGDCAAVRAMVRTIERSDTKFRAKLTKESPVNRCLE